MNEEITEKLSTFVLDTLAEGKEFVLEQAPLVVQDYIRWAVVEGAMNFVLLLCFILLEACFLLFMWRSWNKDSQKQDELPLYVIPGVVSLLFTFCVGLNLSFKVTEGVKAYVAPRAYMIDMVRGK